MIDVIFEEIISEGGFIILTATIPVAGPKQSTEVKDAILQAVNVEWGR